MEENFSNEKYTILVFYRPQKSQNTPKKQGFKVFRNFPKSNYFQIFTSLICWAKVSPEMVEWTIHTNDIQQKI